VASEAGIGREREREGGERGEDGTLSGRHKGESEGEEDSSSSSGAPPPRPAGQRELRPSRRLLDTAEALKPQHHTRATREERSPPKAGRGQGSWRAALASAAAAATHAISPASPPSSARPRPTSSCSSRLPPLFPLVNQTSPAQAHLALSLPSPLPRSAAQQRHLCFADGHGAWGKRVAWGGLSAALSGWVVLRSTCGGRWWGPTRRTRSC